MMEIKANFDFLKSRDLKSSVHDEVINKLENISSQASILIQNKCFWSQHGFLPKYEYKRVQDTWLRTKVNPKTSDFPSHRSSQ